MTTKPENAMSLLECEDKAKQEGYDTATFDMCSPHGRIKCKWLDAYFGLISANEQDDGFMRASDLKNMGFWCENFSANAAT